MNRGSARQDVFLCDEDRVSFLELTAECRMRWALFVHAYVLMDNHYHLFVEDPHGNLSRSMRHLNGVYTQRFNRRQHRDGPLFRGRFRSRLVQHELYASALVTYIHDNPVRAGLVGRPEEYRWSSCWEVNQLADSSYLHERALAHACKQTCDMGTGRTLATLAVSQSGAILGNEDFQKRYRQAIVHMPMKRTRNVPEGRRLACPTVHEVVSAVAVCFGVSSQFIQRSVPGQRNWERTMAIVLSVEWTGNTAEEVGLSFGVRGPAVRAVCARCRPEVLMHPALRQVQDVLL